MLDNDMERPFVCAALQLCRNFFHDALLHRRERWWLRMIIIMQISSVLPSDPVHMEKYAANFA